MKIDMEQALNLLRDATPLYDDAARQASETWGDDVPGMVLMSSMVSQLDRLSDANLERLFSVIEHAIQNGDEEVAAAASTGFLERLLSDASGGRIDFQRVRPFIGPASAEYCIAWNRFTLGPNNFRFDP